MIVIAVFIVACTLAASAHIEESSPKLKIVMFTICNRSHLRPMTSIAQELSLMPNVKVTLVVNAACEEFLRKQNYNFEIEAIRSPLDDVNLETFTLFTLGKHLASYQNNVLEVYIPKWKDPKNRPDIIVHESCAFSGRDLAQLYNLTNVMVATSTATLFSFIDDLYYPQYAPLFTPKGAFQPTDNPLLRALRYIPKKILAEIVLYLINKDSYIVSSKFDIPSFTPRNLDTFFIIESFFGLHYTLLLPPYMSLVGFLEDNRLSNPLSDDVQSWINNSKGFIYISTGSQYKLSSNQQETLIKIFSLMDYDFLVSSNLLKCDFKNVKIVEWTNQHEVLQNKNILAFITHGGHASITEAVQGIVPILCVPKETDQYINCDNAENQGIGKVLRQEQFEYEIVISYLNELITNQSFGNNIKKLKSIMETFKGKKRAAEIIVDLAKTGVDHLIPKFKYLPWYQKNELDIFIIYGIILWIIYFCIKKCWTRNNKNIKIS